ncbi:MAG: hypothetical protein H6Q34_271 [Deltaproteobacteria bacterium]|nr:hypothetical protein [Deltaproteobacteria bacterium]
MVIDSCTFTDITRHLHGISEGLLDGMRKVASLKPDAPAAEGEHHRHEWFKAVEAFVRVNAEVMTLAELLRALLAANSDELSEEERALS